MTDLLALKANILAPFLASFILTVFAIPFVINIASKIKLVDDPKKHVHPAIIHKKPVPRGGGLAILFGVIIAAFIFLPPTGQVLSIIIGGILVVLVGTLDDKFDLSPYLRFATNIIVAAFPVFLGGIGIDFITSPAGGILNFETIPFLPQALAIAWIVWTMNMLNWSKGVDGQMPGIAAIAAITIGILSLRFSPITPDVLTTIKLSFITAGASLGFLLFNFYPAKIFPGYGATILGFLLAISSILGGTKLATAILVMGVPTVDGIFTIIRRIIARRSPFIGDRGHFHHMLLGIGFGQRRIALLYWMFSAILGAVALSLGSSQKFFAILVLIVLFGATLLWLSFLRLPEK